MGYINISDTECMHIYFINSTKSGQENYIKHQGMLYTGNELLNWMYYRNGS